MTDQQDAGMDNNNQGADSAPAENENRDPKADHDANHKEKVEGCEYC